MGEAGMRAQVAESWHRSAAAGVRADADEPPITLTDDELRDGRRAHPLAQVFPILDDVLGQAARDCDAVMAISDASAQLLWLCGQPDVLRRAATIGFVEGSNWDERLVGTNAPGTAVALDQAVNVIGAEHFRSAVQGWSCAASPIHDPSTGALLGVLDITGGDSIAVPQTVAMVRAAARLAEAELARLSTADRTGAVASGSLGDRQASGVHVSLQALGRNEALLTIDAGRGCPAPLRLTPRHSEIMLLLAAAPRGLSGDELAILLYEEDSTASTSAASTLRAELNRLRHLLGAELLASRPYRLAAEVAGDWLEVEALAAAGDVAGSVRRYRGPLLPRSVAPGVVRLREEMAGTLRTAVLSSGAPEVMSTWTRSAWGSDDVEMWQAQRLAVGPRSPLLPLITGQLARIDRELGLPGRSGR